MKRTKSGMGPNQGFKAAQRKRMPTSMAGYDAIQFPFKPSMKATEKGVTAASVASDIPWKWEEPKAGHTSPPLPMKAKPARTTLQDRRNNRANRDKGR